MASRPGLRRFLRLTFCLGLVIFVCASGCSLETLASFNGILPKPGPHSPFDSWRWTLPLVLIIGGPYVLGGLMLMLSSRHVLTDAEAVEPSSTRIGRAAGLLLLVVGTIWAMLNSWLLVRALANFPHTIGAVTFSWGSPDTFAALALWACWLALSALLWGQVWLGWRLTSGHWRFNSRRPT
jgi:hypothetical protein